MESEVVDESTHDASVTHQPQSSSSGGSKRPPTIEQSKGNLGNGKTCEQAVCEPNFWMISFTTGNSEASR